MHYKNDFISYNGGGTDFLGFDDGTRKLPVDPHKNYSFQEVFNQPLQTEITNKYNKEMGGTRNSNLGDYSFSISESLTYAFILPPGLSVALHSSPMQYARNGPCEMKKPISSAKGLRATASKYSVLQSS